MSGGSADRAFELAAELFGLLASPARLRIVCHLRGGEANVGKLVTLIGISQPSVSQHLRVLRRAGLLNRRRVGSAVFYRIVSEPLLLLCDAVCQQYAQKADRAGCARL